MDGEVAVLVAAALFLKLGEIIGEWQKPPKYK